MKKTIQVIAVVGALLLIYSSCSKNRLGEADKSKMPIVTVLEKTLYKADLEGIVYHGMTPEDSAAATQTYIKMWINDRLIYDKAKKNISQKKEIEDLVEEYRTSLIINEYQTKLLRERLSKSVPESELQAFFSKNKERFALKENIIRGLFLKVPKESPALDNFKKWYKQDNENAVKEIETHTLQNAVGYENFYDNWVSFDDVMDNIPEILKDSEDFLKKNKVLEVQDSSFVYMLNIKEYKLQGSEAPFEFIKDYIRDAYIEEKRDAFLKELQTDLYNKALSNDHIKYYVK